MSLPAHDCRTLYLCNYLRLSPFKLTNQVLVHTCVWLWLSLTKTKRKRWALPRSANIFDLKWHYYTYKIYSVLMIFVYIDVNLAWLIFSQLLYWKTKRSKKYSTTQVKKNTRRDWFPTGFHTVKHGLIQKIFL